MDNVQLRHLLNIGRKMAETPALDPLLIYAVDISLQVLNAQNGYLVLMREDGSFEFRVRRNQDGEDIPEAEGQISHTIINRVLSRGKPIRTASAVEDPDFSNALSVNTLQLRSVLCVPLIAHGKTLGALYIENREKDDLFTDTDLEPLQYLASHAAICIDNTALNEELEDLVSNSTSKRRLDDIRLDDRLSTQERRIINTVLENERMNILHNFVQDTLHQFRTPLSVINTSADILSRKMDLGDNIVYLDHIHSQVETIVDLVDSLIMMAKLDQAFVIEDDPVYLQQVIYGMWENFEERAILKTQDIHLHQPDEPIYIRGMVEYIRQAIASVIANAIQYTDEEGRIIVSLEETETAVIVSVEDSGIGIAENEIPHLFTRFYRSDKEGTTRGLGLGLSIVQKIMELHHGEIRVESRLGIGSIFRLFFPKIEG